MNAKATAFLEKIARPPPQEILVSASLLKRGDRVRLRPKAGGDMLDCALSGQTATIDGIEEDDRGRAVVAVVLEDHPGGDLAAARHPAHRYLFSIGEIEPTARGAAGCPSKRVLVAGIGNIFFGDDGFGVAVAQKLLKQKLPLGIHVADFGIRGIDLAYTLCKPYDAAILVDCIMCDGIPGRIKVIEPSVENHETAALDGHRLNPSSVLHFARRMGKLPDRIFIVGCEPASIADIYSISINLSAPVARAVDTAADIIMDLATDILAGNTIAEEDGNV
jgi:hydrogenase maturation protease